MNNLKVLEFWQGVVIAMIGGYLIGYLPFDFIFQLILSFVFGALVYTLFVKPDIDES